MAFLTILEQVREARARAVTAATKTLQVGAF
jgi:hypothetical protein